MSATSIRLLGHDVEPGDSVPDAPVSIWTAARFPFVATVQVDSCNVYGVLGPNNWAQLEDTTDPAASARDNAQRMAAALDRAAKQHGRDARWYLT